MNGQTEAIFRRVSGLSGRTVGSKAALLLLISSLMLNTIPTSAETMSKKEQFGKLSGLDWEEVFHDSGTEDWEAKWFLDGLRASVDNTPQGIVLSAGPIERDHASHCVLWTKASFEGDLKIEFDYWRIDTIQKYVNIIYIQATGIEEGPYTKDIAEWSQLREIPYMRSYFHNMKALHISFAAFGAEPSEEDYVRLRRYPRGKGQKFDEIAVMPDNFNTDLFKPGVKHRFTLIKRGHDVLMQVATDEKTALFAWNTSDYDPITEGRIGLRHMWTRCSRYADFKVSVLK